MLDRDLDQVRKTRREAFQILGLAMGSGLLAACAPSKTNVETKPKPLATINAAEFGKTPSPQVSPAVVPSKTAEATAKPNVASADTILRFDVGDKTYAYWGKERHNTGIYFHLKNAFRVEGSKLVGPIATVSGSFNRPDFIGVDFEPIPERKRDFSFEPLVETVALDTLNTKEFSGKLTVVRHKGDSLAFLEYLAETGQSWTDGTPISVEYPLYARMDNVWELPEGHSRFTKAGNMRFDLAYGATKEGTIAMLWEKYTIKGQ